MKTRARKPSAKFIATNVMGMFDPPTPNPHNHPENDRNTSLSPAYNRAPETPIFHPMSFQIPFATNPTPRLVSKPKFFM
jgi:hypothetical protein